MQKSFVIVKIDEYWFGIDVSAIREIIRSVEITPVALAPNYIAGLINLRGQVIPVIDPGVKLNTEEKENCSAKKCIIMKTINENPATGSREIMGLLVDSIGDIIIIDETEIEAAPPNVGDINTQYIEGIVKLEDKLLTLLKIKEFLLFEKQSFSPV
jgi:purine-binding chemotaxis protein CheW